MSTDPALNPAAILAALGITATTSITPVRGGTDTAIWRVEHSSTTSALRVFRREQAAVHQRELEAMEAARRAGIPVPAIQATGVWHERPVLLLAWCPGVPLWQAVRQHPRRVWSLGQAFGRTQAQIHKIRAPEPWQNRRPDWIDWAGAEDEQLENALRRIASPTPALLHLDYHPLNVLASGTHITGVLDWANARAGDPRADVARTYTILMVEPIVPNRQPLALSLARRLLAWSWRRGYEQEAGKLPDMAWFYAWGGTVMVRDLAWRVHDPQLWWQPEHLARIRNWANEWKHRAEQSA